MVMEGIELTLNEMSSAVDEVASGVNIEWIVVLEGENGRNGISICDGS